MQGTRMSRGRPPITEGQKTQVRERIIASARALFLEQGFDHVSMRKLAQMTGLSPTSLYQYFPGKRHILHHLWEELFAQLSAYCMERDHHSSDPLTRIQILMKAYMTFWTQHPDHFRVIFMTEDLSSPPDQDLNGRGIMDELPLFRTLVAAIEEGIRQGQFRSTDPELIWQTLLIHCHGTVSCLVTIREIPWRPAGELMTQSIETTLRGLMAH